VVFAAPSPVAVETDKELEAHPDGTATVYGGFGKGATYTVTSRSVPVTAALLRAAGRVAIPALVLNHFASPAPTTARVNTLARQITASAPTTYDKIRAIEAWLGAHVKYSLNAPPSRPNVDVVDDFLFRTRIGWCEQVASSLVVMARSVGIPARLATGFVPGHRDPLSGQFVVRERDAHAWAEIYFAGVGWQPFDPTASVPLAGDAGRRKLIETSDVVPYIPGVIAGTIALPKGASAARTAVEAKNTPNEVWSHGLAGITPVS